MPSNLPVQDNLTKLWEKVVHLVSKQSQNANLDIFLAGSRPINIDEGTLWVVFPNKFFRDWIETRYLNQLNESLNAIIGEPLRLRLIVNGEYPSTETNNPHAAQEISHAEVDTLQQQIHTQTSQQPAQQTSQNIQGTPTDTQPNVQIITAPSPSDESVTSQSLNPKYTFDTFVVGSANRFAHAAALAAASKPATVYNPLFLYGGVGLGKTHLMQAVGHYVLEHLPNMHVVYVSSERFTNDLINSLQNKSMAEFRQKYRNVDVLLIDDIQFIAGKESTQEEFFHTFNALYQANKQIVLSSDRLPKEIPTLEDRLRSRFESGLTADVQAPDLETRVAILRQKARSDNIVVPDDVLDLIATNIQSNIRELEGALTRVMAYAAVHEGPVTVPMAAEALKEIISTTQAQPITIRLIQETVVAFFNLKVSDLTGKRRSRAIVHPRQIAMYLARELTDASLPRIGEQFGGRDHTTVMHACDKIRSELESDPNIASTIRTLTNQIKDRT